MGFTTGFLGGVTLTYSILYMSLYIHRANRSVQRTLVSQQAALLNSVVDPLPAPPEPPAYEIRRAGITEQLKDRWNREIEKLVRNFYETDWDEKRVLYEKRLAGAWERLRDSQQAKDLEAKATELGSELKGKAKDLKSDIKDKVKGAESAAAEAKDELKNSTREPRLLELR